MFFINKFIDEKKFPQEIESGNIEYKRKLYNLSKDRIEKLTSQLNWRLNEGFLKYNKYIAIYILGIEDNGTISNQNEEEIKKSIDEITKVIDNCNSILTSKKIINFNSSFIAEIHIEKKKKEYKNKEEVKIAFLGNSNSGKTTLFSILTHSINDDGKGFARNKMLKHLHEYSNGLTTSINYDIIGFKNKKIINYSNIIDRSWESIIKSSDKIVSLIDLPGSNKYLKTLLFGLFAHKPNYICFVIDCTNVNKKKFKFYKNIINNFEIDYFFVLTKIEKISETIHSKIKKSLEIYNKSVFSVSNITNKNINDLINHLEYLKCNNKINCEQINTEFLINDTFKIPEMGTVVCGIVLSGSINTGDILYIGQYTDKLIKIKIKSIHKKHIPSEKICENELGSMLIEIIDNKENIKINKRMFIVNEELINNFSNEFYILINDNNINNLNLKFIIYINNLKINVKLKELKVIDNKIRILVNSNIKCYIKNNNKVVISDKFKLYFGKIIKN